MFDGYIKCVKIFKLRSMTARTVKDCVWTESQHCEPEFGQYLRAVAGGFHRRPDVGYSLGYQPSVRSLYRTTITSFSICTFANSCPPRRWALKRMNRDVLVAAAIVAD